MFKYKWDKMQIAIVVMYIIFVICLLYFPYKLNVGEKEIFYGYKSFLHWVLIFYMLRICLHLFGWEVYNFKGNLIGVTVIIVGSTYFKFLFGRKEGFEIMYTGFFIPVVAFILLTALLLIDRFLYTLERR